MDGRDGRGDRLWVADVTHERDRSAGRKLRAPALQAVTATGDRGDAGTGGGERASDARADAARGSGDERGRAGELHPAAILACAACGFATA